MDVLAVLELAGSVDNLPQTVADITRLYKLVQGGKPDVAAMDKANTLEPTVGAAERLVALFDKLLKDPSQRPHAVALVSSLFQ